MGSRDIPIDSNVYLYSGNISHFLTLHDVYRPAPHLNLRQDCDVRVMEDQEIIFVIFRLTVCGVWSPALGLQPSPEDKLELRTDLTGVVLRGTSETEPPFSQTEPAGRSLPRGQVRRQGDHREVTVHQFYGDVWKGLQEATNFSFSMVRTSVTLLPSLTPQFISRLAQWIITGARGWTMVPGTEW